MPLPTSIDDAIVQAQAATQAAIQAGYTRIQIELMLPELKPMEPTRQFVSAFSDYGEGLKIFFTDAGAAALARRDWGDIPYPLRSVDVAGARQTSAVEELVDPADRVFVFVAPSAVEVTFVEKVCLAAGDRPVIMFNPRLEDISVVGIGYAGRQLRERFLNLFESVYYLRPLEQAAIFRAYPAKWQVWLEQADGYQIISEDFQKPSAEELDGIFAKALGKSQVSGSGFLSNLQRLLKALGQ